jgi:putative phosphonate metabolism protein
VLILSKRERCSESGTAPLAFERYAIYWAPAAESALAAFGRSWLGIDERTGDDYPRETHGLDRAFTERITAEARRYALHATLKAPFRLSPNADVGVLRERMARFAASRPAFAVSHLALKREGAFLALMPAAASLALDRLAVQLVVGFDEFRAAIDASDRARRRVDRLTPIQRLLLEEWGYPYVFDQFRFHVTLTTGLDARDQERVEAALAPVLEPICAEPLMIDAVCLFGDSGEGRPFRLIQRFAFTG